MEKKGQNDRSKSLLVITLNVNVIKRLDELIKTYFNYIFRVFMVQPQNHREKSSQESSDKDKL